MSRKRNVPPVSNFDGAIVFSVGIVSFVGMAALVSALGMLAVVGSATGYIAIAIVVLTTGVLTGVTMRITNRLAWHRQAMRHAAALRRSAAGR